MSEEKLDLERAPDEAPRWLDDPANVRKIYLGLWIVCLVLIAGGEGLLVWDHHRSAAAGEVHHGFDFERWPGFYALYGFVGCVSLLLGAKELRKVLMRDEDYYDD